MTGSTFGLSKIVYYSSNFFCFFIKLTKLFLSDVTFSSVFRTVQVNKRTEQFTVHTQKKRERHWKECHMIVSEIFQFNGWCQQRERERFAIMCWKRKKPFSINSFKLHYKVNKNSKWDSLWHLLRKKLQMCSKLALGTSSFNAWLSTIGKKNERGWIKRIMCPGPTQTKE